jgi:hypothetical protein
VDHAAGEGRRFALDQALNRGEVQAREQRERQCDDDRGGGQQNKEERPSFLKKRST